jgi:endonuclease/exonuclease/phosphatase (EEP) superfamily protein YafD
MLVRVTLTVLAVVVLMLLALSTLPYVETNRWFVRVADFPRLQLLVAIAATLIAAVLLLRRRRLLAGMVVTALLVAATLHAITLWPYRPGGAAFIDACEPGRELSILVSNVLMENRRADALLATAEREQPDLFLALETDAWWDAELAPIGQRLPHRVQDIGDKTYGIHLFSRLPLVQPRIHYFAQQDVPAIIAGVTLPSGETVGFIGLHPRPPRFAQPTTGRDAQLYAAAFQLRESDRATVVAGDLNATPWETTIERMRRIGRLVDPRHGYGYLPTYSARSWWRSWPLDHVLYQPGFATLSLARLDDVGSDHFPYLARLCRVDTPERQPPSLRDGDLDEARTALSRAEPEAPRTR